MGRRVAIGRVVAAADVAAFEADPQMQPAVAGGQASLAPRDGLGQLVKLQILSVLTRHPVTIAPSPGEGN
jgi:hypothetical protein